MRTVLPECRGVAVASRIYPDRGDADLDLLEDKSVLVVVGGRGAEFF
jgi:hypothetical protein